MWWSESGQGDIGALAEYISGLPLDDVKASLAKRGQAQPAGNENQLRYRLAQLVLAAGSDDRAPAPVPAGDVPPVVDQGKLLEAIDAALPRRK